MKHSQDSDKPDSQPPSHQPDPHAQIQRKFRWQVDEFFNIAEVCCRRWARQSETDNAPERIAVRVHQACTEALFHTYSELQQAADALSHVLAGLGVQRGDRVAIVMPQRFETAVAFMAVFQMGAVAMPLSMLFGPEALAFRLQDSETVVAICDESSIASVNSVRAACPALRSVVAAGQAAGQGDVDYAAAVAAHQRAFTAVKTRSEEAAVLIYTSGTTGQPKGALIPHRALIGNLPGFVCSQNWFGFDGVDGANNPTSGAVFWSPADWAWTGGLMDALLPTLYFGRPIVAFNGRFSPELAFSLMQAHGVTHSFLFPTALKAMMKAYPRPREQFSLQLQGLMSAGEAVGDAVFDYCRTQLGVVVNEMFGQTEINYVVGNCAMNLGAVNPAVPAPPALPGKSGAQGVAVYPIASLGEPCGWPAKPGSMGKAYPGHRVAVLDDEGHECAVGVPGDVSVNRFDIHGDPDPIFFLGYWNNDAATRAKFTGDWCRTGDLARVDADGYLWYEGRADDVFKAAGYRIGPGEIENCLVKHPAVANAAVVPKPDKERGAVVKAYVVLSPELIAARADAASAGAGFDKKLVAELQAHVKKLLAPYEYPKEIEFIDALPMTTTGKVQRRVLRLQEEARFKNG
ncbi:acetyl-CoA synthetase [Polaromonas sp. CG_9.5]|nr:acetyl-CoA synthetase [Polaromonas sp. CG_9.5]